MLTGLSIAFLTLSCFEEILNGAKDKMIQSKWLKFTEQDGGLIVYVHAAFTA